MKKVATFFIFSSLLISNQTFADESVCIKDGEEITISGDSAKDKRKNCEAKGGALEVKFEKAQAAPVPTRQAPAKPAISGTAAGW